MDITITELKTMKAKQLRRLVREAINEVLLETSELDVKNAKKAALDLKMKYADAEKKAADTEKQVATAEKTSLGELARIAKGFRLTNPEFDASTYTKRISGNTLADFIEYFREHPGAEVSQVQQHFNLPRAQQTNAIVKGLYDAGILTKLTAAGDVVTPVEPGEEGSASTVVASEPEDMFVGGAENPLSMYFDNEPNDDGSEDFEPEAGEIEKAAPINVSNVSDADMDASYKYSELERRLAATKSNILKLRKGRTSAGDISDKPSTELQRLRDLKVSLEKRIADLKASSAYVRRLSNTPEPEDIEMPNTEEEPLDEWAIGKMQYYAGIKK